MTFNDRPVAVQLEHAENARDKPNRFVYDEVVAPN